MNKLQEYFESNPSHPSKKVRYNHTDKLFADELLLLELTRQGRFPEVQDLVTVKKVNINFSDKDGVTALHIAILNDDLLITRFLIANGANINAQTIHGFTPLHYAVSNNAVSNKNLDIISVLMNNNADITIKNEFGFTPLQLAPSSTTLDSNGGLYERLLAAVDILQVAQDQVNIEEEISPCLLEVIPEETIIIIGDVVKISEEE